MSTTSHCVFCLKPAAAACPPQSHQAASSSSSTTRFLELLERAVQLEPASTKKGFFTVCGTYCGRTLESFSSLYGELQELELKLGWELSKLKDVMEHANHVPSRGSFVKGCYEGEGEKGKGMMEDMYTWRRSLTKRCDSRLSASFPKVCIPKLARGAIQEERSVKMEVIVTSPPALPQSYDVDVVEGGNCGEEEANNSSQMEYTSIDIKYEIPSPTPYSPPEPDDHESITGSLAESPSADEPSNNVKPETLLVPVASSTTTTLSAERWCAICSILYPTGYHFRRHYSRAHDFKRVGLQESDAVRCSQCPAYFVSSRSLSIHITHVHQHQQQTRVKSEKDAGTGRKVAADGRFQFQCSKCPKSFLVRSSLKDHFKSNHNLTGIGGEADVKECKVSGCFATFRTGSQLHKHRLEFHAAHLIKTVTGKPCICVECGKAFITRYKLRLHSQSEHLKKPVPPPPRRLASNNKNVLKECPKCGKVLRGRRSLYVHLLQHGGPESFRYPCSTCGKKFVTKDKRDKHLPVHNKKQKHRRRRSIKNNE